MKKPIISFLSLAMIFVAIASGFSANIAPGPGSANTDIRIRYQVNVQMSTDLPLCNTYLVKLLNGDQQMVAPAKQYIPGVTTYSFYEKGPVSGVRVAVLVRANFNNFICLQELITAPSSINGLFLNGNTYYFQLDPQVHTYHVPIK